MTHTTAEYQNAIVAVEENLQTVAENLLSMMKTARAIAEATDDSDFKKVMVAFVHGLSTTGMIVSTMGLEITDLFSDLFDNEEEDQEEDLDKDLAELIAKIFAQ